jgi:hypothetical protein
VVEDERIERPSRVENFERLDPIRGGDDLEAFGLEPLAKELAKEGIVFGDQQSRTVLRRHSTSWRAVGGGSEPTIATLERVTIFR